MKSELVENWLSVESLPLQSLVDLVTDEEPSMDHYKALCAVRLTLERGLEEAYKQLEHLNPKERDAVFYQGKHPRAMALYHQAVTAITHGALLAQASSYCTPSHDARYAPPVEFTVYWIKPQDFLKWNKRRLAWAGLSVVGE